MKNNNSLIIAAGAGAAVYFLFPQIKEFLVGGEYSGSGTTGQSGTVLDDAIKKEQTSFITKVLNNAAGTEIYTTTLNDYARATIVTGSQNIKAVESAASFKVNANTDTAFLYNGSTGSIIGGSDFGTNQSLTKKAAQVAYNTKTNPIVTIARSSGGSSSSSKKVARSSTAKDPVIKSYEDKHKQQSKIL
jgi:hypothetical protein